VRLRLLRARRSYLTALAGKHLYRVYLAPARRKTRQDARGVRHLPFEPKLQPWYICIAVTATFVVGARWFAVELLSMTPDASDLLFDALPFCTPALWNDADIFPHLRWRVYVLIFLGHVFLRA